MESSTYGSELVAARIGVEMVIEVRYKLRMLGMGLEKTSLMVGDNMSVILKTTIPSSMFKTSTIPMPIIVLGKQLQLRQSTLHICHLQLM